MLLKTIGHYEIKEKKKARYYPSLLERILSYFLLTTSFSILTTSGLLCTSLVTCSCFCLASVNLALRFAMYLCLASFAFSLDWYFKRLCFPFSDRAYFCCALLHAIVITPFLYKYFHYLSQQRHDGLTR